MTKEDIKKAAEEYAKEACRTWIDRKPGKKTF